MSHTVNQPPPLVLGLLQRATKDLLLLTILLHLVIPPLPYFLLLRTTRKQQHVLCPEFTLPHSPPPVCLLLSPSPNPPTSGAQDGLFSSQTFSKPKGYREGGSQSPGVWGGGRVRKQTGRAKRTGTHKPWPLHKPRGSLPGSSA